MRAEPPMFTPAMKRIFQRFTVAFLLGMPLTLLVILWAPHSWLVVPACMLPGVVTVLLVYPLMRSQNGVRRGR